ncbi:glycosyltransferase family 2 protein [Pigmentibacter sp. JX0631]|uniref:glycosyltransferase family 2 protein n=1 Tax=Pigmentibacter sp. JX0631 TaxID=2976982 RepID=UPI0024687D69|nr:glycosyltransferase family 2 protein [Pigmentibacter sp. JX0631]WGL59275.1 glycosyltransferase family 2 protein [Pigmentibacter sp. JX0631]
MFISLIIPTYNESKNVPILIQRISETLSDVKKEVIIVDDNSPDKTWEIARELSSEYPWLRVIRRMNDRGLSSAVLAGFEISEGEILAVMDSDLQHDEKALINFIKAFENGAEIVVGSRKVKGGGIEDWSKGRMFISWVATILAKIALPKSISDPMSGFFALKRNVYVIHKNEINPKGFKILLEFLARAKNNKIEEVGYTFKSRIHGESKLSSKVILQYIHALYELSIGQFIPAQFIKYVFVGSTGLIFATISLFICQYFFHLSQSKSLAISIEFSILTNFFLNNYWTFKYNKLVGIKKILRGLITFHAICLGGALINQAIALKLITLDFTVYLANALGYFIAAIWNYIININITWKGKA